MKNIRKEFLVWVQIGAISLIWAIVLFVSGTAFKIDWELIKKLPEVVTIYVLLAFFFTKWAWRWPIFKKWLVPFPDLQGTWKGMIQSTWIDPETGKRASPREVVIAIKQTFSSISCSIYTDESDSYSIAAQIHEDDESGSYRLSYNYINRPRATIRDRSTIHDGAAILKIILSPEKKLEGEYWTSRKTTGDISVNFVSNKVAQSFK